MVSAARGQYPALLLEVDPDLGRYIEPSEWEVARGGCAAEVVSVPRGPWPSPHEADNREDLVAFVISEGLVAREISVRDRWMVELLGATDVLQPPIVTDPPRLGTRTRLTAVTDVSMLVLGQQFIQAAARWPTLLTTIQRRLELQREGLAIQGVIAHLPRTEHRLLLMLWHLADRWGYVTPEGIVLPWPLNHEILGQLVGARRPTVTIALRGLQTHGGIGRREDGSWLLTGTAERMVNAITRSPGVTRSIGQRLMLYRQMRETTARSHALQAEAKQVRLGSKPTDGSAPRRPAAA